MRMVRVMCSGRVDLAFVLRAFSNGTDGVFIGGCRLKECNYTTHGNYHALNMVLLCKKIMERIGLNPERLRIEFMSAGEGILFADVVNDFGKTIKGIGALGEAEGLDEKELKSKLEDVTKLIPYIKLAKRDKISDHPGQDAHGELFSTEEVDRLFREAPSYYIDPDKCQACAICSKKCPVEAISGGKNIIHVIDQDKCIRCGNCFEVCPDRFSAVSRIVGTPVPLPVPEEKRTLVRKSKKQ